MGTLYIDRKDLHIKLDGQALAFYSKEGREGVVPINPLKRVVMVGNILIETSVLNRLSNEGISVLFLSGKRLRFCGILHGRLHNNGILRVKQYEKSLSGFRMEVALDIVKRKISGQRDLLMYVRENRPDLRFTMTNAVCTLQGIILEIEKIPPLPPFNKGGMGGFLETLRGLEGGASATYFSAYTTIFPESLGFNKRNKRPPEDPVNAMLSLCYTILHFEMVREIEVIGLDPTIGFYHQFKYGRESLACDLVESYRPSVDRFVWELFRERTFTNRDFALDDERPGCYLKKGGRQRFYQLYEEWAQKMRPLWTEEVRGIARRIMDGQDPVY
jgi:CRISPR-associated protein Cas1